MSEETKEIEIPKVFLEKHENLYRLVYQTLNKWAEEGNRERLAYFRQYIEILAGLMVHESGIYREIARTLISIQDHNAEHFVEESALLGDMIHMVYNESFQKLENTPEH